LIIRKKACGRLLSIFLLLSLSATLVYADEPPWAVPAKTVTKYVTDRVNFRSGPSTETDILLTFNRGDDVEFISIYNYEWSAVIHGGTKGFIKSEFLSLDKPVEPLVELMEWSEVKSIFTIGVAAEVYDVRTGLTYYVKSFSNGMHADVEPVTTQDTEIMKSTYNNHWDWDGRPVWVTINGHTIAAAINGMPHGGGVNGDNGMNGQVCLHFKGSTVHNGNMTYSRQLQAVVTEAYGAS
jgi:uncharacterized protein YraI